MNSRGYPFCVFLKKKSKKKLKLCYWCKEKGHIARDCKYDIRQTKNKVEHLKKKTSHNLKLMEEDEVGYVKTICVIDQDMANKTNKNNWIQDVVRIEKLVDKKNKHQTLIQTLKKTNKYN
jgi:Zinc knuckle